MRITRKDLTVTCGILTLAAFLPHLALPVATNAAGPCSVPAKIRTMKKAELFTELSRAKIKSILAEPIPAVAFQQMPLRDVLLNLKELSGINIYFDPEELGDVIDPDVPINLDLAENSMTFKTLINEFILGPNDLVIVIRDNYLSVTSYEKSLTEYEVVVYDCRDLLATMPASSPASGSVVGKGRYETDAGPGSSGRASATFSTRERQLIETIYTMVIDEDSPWDDNTLDVRSGDEWVGTISAVNGLLVVRQTQAIHEQVEQLLEKLRTAMHQRN